ncbi:hypothetical protein Dimus_005917, partial [Dionaea muscipula]
CGELLVAIAEMLSPRRRRDAVVARRCLNCCPRPLLPCCWPHKALKRVARFQAHKLAAYSLAIIGHMVIPYMAGRM